MFFSGVHFFILWICAAIFFSILKVLNCKITAIPTVEWKRPGGKIKKLFKLCELI